MAHTVRLNATEYAQKKAAIAGVMDFNDANNLMYSKIRLFKHFGITAKTGYAWFPVPEMAGPRRGRPKAGATRKEHGPARLKRSRSEDEDENDDDMSILKSEPDETLSPTPKRQNPVRNGGRGRKRLKEAIEGLTKDSPSNPCTPPPMSPQFIEANASSPTPPRQLLTPPSKGRGRGKKEFKHEEIDEVEV